MPVFIPQPSFTGGEWAPSLHARQDLTKFGTSLRVCINMIIHAHGGASNRAGTAFVGEVKTSSAIHRLIPFSFSTTQTYTLVFGDSTLRVVKDGGFVIDSGSPPDLYEIATPYASADLALLKFTQSADVMTITHPDYADRELTRTDHDAWTLSTITRGTQVAAPAGTPTATASGFGAGSETHSYKITAVVGSDESLASAVATTATLASTWAAGALVKLAWTAVSGAEYYNVYKQPFSGGPFGFIGATSTNAFVDDNIEAEFDESPLDANADPFSGADDYPSCVAYFQERLTYANTNNNPQTTWWSRTGAYPNFNVSTPPRDNDSIEVTVAAREVNAIKHLVPLGRSLVALTSGYPWVFRGPSGEGITPHNIEADPQGKRGCSDVPPIVIGNTILYVQAKGSNVRELEYSFDKDLYDGSDLSILANHLFEGRQIVEWAYSETPHSIIWCVLDNGALIALTYMKDHEVWGWHRHETDGTVESVCVISEGNEDAVYFIVNRTIEGATKRYVERLHTRLFTDIRDAFFVDSGLSLDVPIDIVGITKADPGVVDTGAVAHGISNGDRLDISDVVGMTEVNYQRYTAANVTTYTLELTDQYPGDDIDTSNFTTYVSGGKVRKVVTSISGLDHLEGETVSILTDGSVHPQEVVSSGAITLDYGASRVHVGLPYQSDLETLPTDLQGKIPVYGKQRIVPEIVLHLLNSRGFWAGYDTDHLVEFKQRGLAGEDYHEPTALFTGKAHLTLTSKWREEGTLYIQQRDPLPVTVLAIAPGEEMGE